MYEAYSTEISLPTFWDPKLAFGEWMGGWEYVWAGRWGWKWECEYVRYCGPSVLPF